ncbi:MAG: hypothetical protein MZV65_01165 [Chromatiales bacterium]|nr:hypothetical protein [Chromatiales bacterium]
MDKQHLAPDGGPVRRRHHGLFRAPVADGASRLRALRPLPGRRAGRRPRRKPLVFAGRAACADCHGDVVAARAGSRHAQIGCEACHGPLHAHVQAGGEKKPARPDSRALCARCHESSPWKPKAYPQVVVTEHSPSGSCIAAGCHKPHAPKMS